MNQTQKNMQSTKSKPTTWEQPLQSSLEQPNTPQLMGKKVWDVFTRVHDVRKTAFSDQTGRFPMQSQHGNKYIMVMVKIGSNAILVEPINSRNDHKLASAYGVLMTRLQQAGIVPEKHILDNKVSEAIKTIIKDKYKMTMELTPPGCHRRNKKHSRKMDEPEETQTMQRGGCTRYSKGNQPPLPPTQYPKPVQPPKQMPQRPPERAQAQRTKVMRQRWQQCATPCMDMLKDSQRKWN